jgi:hypothetical protein
MLFAFFSARRLRWRGLRHRGRRWRHCLRRPVGARIGVRRRIDDAPWFAGRRLARRSPTGRQRLRGARFDRRVALPWGGA